MFDRKKPCGNCPFRVGRGSAFRLTRARLEEIAASDAFQCHKTVDYDNYDDPMLRQGSEPQQCAGLMAVLIAEGQPNTIMRVAQAFRVLDPATLDGATAYASWQAVLDAHLTGTEPPERNLPSDQSSSHRTKEIQS